jgi:membrane protease YdiL (CAAX protease family)
MSILAQAATDGQIKPLLEVVVPLVLVAWTLGALVAAWKFRIFTGEPLRSVEPRLAPDESLANYAMILLAGLCAWILIPAVYAAATDQRSMTRPATAPLITDPSELISLTAVASSAALLILLAGNFFFRRDGLSRIGLRLGQLVPAVPIGVLGIILIMPFIFWAGVVTMKLWELLGLRHEMKHEMLRILENTDDRGLAFLLVFSAGVLAPLYEEFLFRGHLQTLLVHLFARLRPERDVVMEPYATPNAALMRARGPSTAAKWMGIVLASLAFAVVHPWWTIPPIFFLSVCLGYAYERWNNLWVPIVLHALFNGISITISQYVP